MQLYQRVEEILKLKKVSKTLLAKMLEVPQATLTRYFNDEQQEKLLAYLPRILTIYSEISRNWLYFGEGEMYKTSVTAPKFIVRNNKQELIGDNLLNILNHLNIAQEEIISRCEISTEELQAVLDSRTMPSFTFMNKLYLEFEINPTIFMDRNNPIWIFPKSSFEQILLLTNKYRSYTFLDYTVVQELFGAEKQEAKDFIEKFKEAKTNLAKLGLQKINSENNDNPNEYLISGVALKAKWIKYFEQNYEFEINVNNKYALPNFKKKRKIDISEELNQQIIAQQNIANYEKAEKLRLEDKISQLTQENARLRYQLEELGIDNTKKVS